MTSACIFSNYIKLKSLWPDCLTGWGAWPDWPPLDPPLAVAAVVHDLSIAF